MFEINLKNDTKNILKQNFNIFVNITFILITLYVLYSFYPYLEKEFFNGSYIVIAILLLSISLIEIRNLIKMKNSKVTIFMFPIKLFLCFIFILYFISGVMEYVL